MQKRSPTFIEERDMPGRIARECPNVTEPPSSPVIQIWKMEVLSRSGYDDPLESFRFLSSVYCLQAIPRQICYQVCYRLHEMTKEVSNGEQLPPLINDAKIAQVLPDGRIDNNKNASYKEVG